MATNQRVCPNCGHSQDSGEFCENCGTRLAPAQAPPPPGTSAQAPGGGAAQGPGQGAYYVPPMPPRGKSFWGRLFDLSFEEFVTPSLIKVLYVLAMVVIALGVIGAIVMGFMAMGAFGVFVLIMSLVAGFLYLLFARVALELVIIFFRIRDNTDTIAHRK